MSDAVELAEVPQLFERWLAGRPLADRSRQEYARNVRAVLGATRASKPGCERHQACVGEYRPECQRALSCSGHALTVAFQWRTSTDTGRNRVQPVE